MSNYFITNGMLNRTSHLLANSSKALLRLECLSIDITSLKGEHLQELFRSTFPHLVHCSLGTHDSHWSSPEPEDTLASFLLRHPALKTLHIQYWNELEVWPSTSARIPLLHLERLRCPARLVPYIFSHSLAEVVLYWVDVDSEQNEVEKTFVTLKEMMSRTEISFLCINYAFEDDFPEIVDSLSRNIPHTKTLRLALLDYPDDPREIIRHLRDCLSSFTGLIFLSLECICEPDRYLSGAEDEDPQTVQAFGDACRTLEGCRLQKCAWRKVDGIWENHPLEDFMVLAGIRPVL
ncbi:hypothetical protein FB451DRAFT_393760 [Mycena latifolia]|nr:hypothetical protein FB451DRAFT_393760 [Mycena latifolia]